jgi:N-acetylmuramoyl-L-alanine amidase
MRKVNLIVIHCSASRPKAAATQRASDIDAMHKARGWRRIGYHYFIRTDGTVERGRAEADVGAHVSGHNSNSIGVCYAGGLDEAGSPADTRTAAQKAAMSKLVHDLTARYRGAKVLGHRDLSPDKDGDGVVEKHEWLKDCPCFDAPAWWREQRGDAS